MKSSARPISVASLLRTHFRVADLHQLVTASRSFPIAARVDLQCALLEILDKRLEVTHRSGIQAGYAFQTFTFSMLSLDRDQAPVIAPLEYEDVDIGEAVPVRGLKSTVWLCNQSKQRLAVLLTPVLKHSEVGGWQVEIAILPKNDDHNFIDGLLSEIEMRINHPIGGRSSRLSSATTTLAKPEECVFTSCAPSLVSR
jgi:hypothetical protein